MSARLRRLQADHQEMILAFERHPQFRILKMEGQPPERYAMELRVQGLEAIEDGGVRAIGTHRAEIYLPLEYPRRSPICRMLTPVFHPNIDAQKICIGDHWSAGQSLPQLVLQIGQMLCYQSYNVKSPLNALAAAWAEKNIDRLPLFGEDLAIAG